MAHQKTRHLLLVPFLVAALLMPAIGFAEGATQEQETGLVADVVAINVEPNREELLLQVALLTQLVSLLQELQAAQEVYEGLRRSFEFIQSNNSTAPAAGWKSRTSEEE